MRKAYMLLVFLVYLHAAHVAAAQPLPSDYAQAIAPRDWQFPRDHGQHPRFKTEWWYFTGNLHTSAGRELGYQLTFFRNRLSPAEPPRDSPWATTTLFLAHAHISDPEKERFVFRERSSRARPGLAAAAEDSLDVHLLKWSARLSANTITLRAQEPSFGIELECALSCPVTLQAPGGLSPKGREPGQASYYYSLTRMPTSGSLRIADEVYAVTGDSWMDHEFSSNHLGADQSGWDWVSVHLDDGQDVMVYRLRDRDGHTDFAFATVLDASGAVRYFSHDAVTLEGSRPWTSPHTGGVYPQHWHVAISGWNTMDIMTRFRDQEMRTGDETGINYYEGVVEVRGAKGQRIGRGYLEMTGYAEDLGDAF